MGSLTNLSIMFFIIFLTSFSFSSNAATFTVRNSCPYTVWAAANPGGGRCLKQGQYWLLRVPAGTSNARIWGRTNCNFNASGHGHCETGDCGGLLHCEGLGNPPNTLAEYSLNQHNRRDFISISLVEGFNIPMEFGPTNRACRGINCTADINGQCPKELTTPGGCHNPCTVFNTTGYCCTNGPGSCGPTDFSKFFKEMCPDAYSYPQDDPTSTISCPSGYTNYKVVFCPKTSFTSQFPLMEIIKYELSTVYLLLYT